MAVRLVLAWVGLTVMVNAVVWDLALVLGPRLAYGNRSLLTLLSIVAGPAAQWIALRIVGVAWRREWAVATIAGAVFSTAAIDLLNAAPFRLAPALNQTLASSALAALFVALLRWHVLRRHVRFAALWLGVALIVFALRVLLRNWMLTAFGGAPAAPSMFGRMAFPALTAVVESIAVAWLIAKSPQETSRARPAPARAWFVFEWATAAGVAVLAVMTAADLLASAATSARPRIVLTIPVLATLAGLAIGAMQWWVLRRTIRVDAWWIAASTLALALPALAIFVPGPDQLVAYAWFLGMYHPIAPAVLGAWFGLVQWFVLRHHVRGAWLWIPAMALAGWVWYLRIWLYGVSMITVGVLGGIISGLALVWLLPRAGAGASPASVKPALP